MSAPKFEKPKGWVSYEQDEIGLTSSEAARLLEEHGRNEIPEKIVPWWVMLGKQFLGPMPGMIAAAAVLSLVIACIDPANGPWPDFGICTFMLLLNSILGFREELHANAAAQALKEKTMPEVSVKRDNKNQMIDARELVPGDVVFLRAGQKCPVDGEWLSGDALGVDNAALNGESEVVKVSAKLRGVWSSAMVRQSGGSYIVARKTGVNTMIGETAMEMQESSGVKKGKFQQTIEKLVKVVITAALTMVVVILIVQHAVRDGKDILETMLACVSLLIGSVPVALPVVLTVTLALGSARMAAEGAIVTNLSALQEVAVMTVLCSDKTGTLTTAKMSVYPTRIWPAYKEFDRDQVLMFAGLASNADDIESHIDAGVLRICNEHFPDWEARRKRFKQLRFIGFEPETKRVSVFVQDTQDGKYYHIGKGLLNKILENEGDGGAAGGAANCWTCHDVEEVRARALKEDKALADDAFKTISVCVRECSGVTQDEDGLTLMKYDQPMRFMGVLPMRDPPRHDTKATIKCIRDAGIGVKMITGDHLMIGIKTAEQIELGSEIKTRNEIYEDVDAKDKKMRHEFIRGCDGFAQVIPTDKSNVVKALQELGLTVGMTGDGVNDAAALSAANVGVAVKGAVDAARAASDIILTEGGLSPIFSAVIESRCIFQRLRSYVIYRIAHSIHVVCTLSILVLGFDYTLDPLYVILMALFNDLAITMIGYDHAIPTREPSVPRVSTMLFLAASTGICQACSSIILFKFGYHFPLQDDHGSLLPASFGRHGYQDNSGNGDDYIGTCLYLQMATTAGLLMFSTRTRRCICAGNPPNWRLVLSIGIAFVITVFMTGFKTIHIAISWLDVVIILGYNVTWAIVIEMVKIIVICIMPEDIADRDCCTAEEIPTIEDRMDDQSEPLVHPTSGIQEQRHSRGSLTRPPGSGVHSGLRRTSSARSAVLSGITGGAYGTEQAVRESLASARDAGSPRGDVGDR